MRRWQDGNEAFLSGWVLLSIELLMIVKKIKIMTAKREMVKNGLAKRAKPQYLN